MIVFRGAQKLLKRLGVPKAKTPAPASTTVLGDWYATYVILGRQHLILCINEGSLGVVVVPAKELTTLPDRFRSAVEQYLLRLGIERSKVDEELRGMHEFQFAPTASRKILGCLNEAEWALTLHLEPPAPSLEDLQTTFSTFIYSTNGYRFPREVVKALFAAKRAAS